MKPLWKSRVIWLSALGAGVAGVCAVLSADPGTPHGLLVGGNCLNAFLAGFIAVLRASDKRKSDDTNRTDIKAMP